MGDKISPDTTGSVQTESVSRFFRNPLMFEVLENCILPELFSKKNSIRIWSAGCSSGEEPYSIAILCDRLLSQEQYKGLSVEIFATDYKAEVIEKARQGIYDKSKFEEVKLEILEKYFTAKKNQYVISPTIRERVNFSLHDLISASTPYPSESIFGGFDCILCRNTLIYYDSDVQKRVIGSLINGISKGGFMILGNAEQLTIGMENQLEKYIACLPVYRKI